MIYGSGYGFLEKFLLEKHVIKDVDSSNFWSKKRKKTKKQQEK